MSSEDPACTLRVLDFFSGCGGLSLGFHAAGFRLLGGIERNEVAARTHARNFFESAAHHARARDITDPKSLRLDQLVGPPRGSKRLVDVIVAGPPCQPFARIGRAKLREVLRHPNAFLRDERSQLWRHLFSCIDALRPLAVVIENVPDFLNHGSVNVAGLVARALEAEYDVRYTILNAANFGVPQNRDRAFLVAFRKDLGLTGTEHFPAPLRRVKQPEGYAHSRTVATRLAREEECPFFKPLPGDDACRQRAVTVRGAIGDLPGLTESEKNKGGKKNLDGPLKAYQRPASRGTYAHLMRSWPGFRSPAGVREQVTRCLVRDWETFAAMKPGDQYPQAHAIAVRRFERREKQERRALGRDLTAPEYEALWKSIVPPYSTGKFPNKWQKLDWDRPAHTLPAHLEKDGYSHIHPSDEQARVLTVREAARLQSFPDGFIFEGAMNAAFRQIGNAVPPLLARAVADVVKERVQGALEVRTKGRRRRAS